MKNKEIKIRFMMLAIGFILIVGWFQPAVSQDLRWLRVGQLQSYFVDYGSENESSPINNNTFAWPAQYGDNQYTSRMKGLWIGAQNFYDPAQGKVVNTKVIGSGPRYDAIATSGMIFSRTIKLVGRSSPPIVIVDDQLASGNSLYDVLDEQDDNLPCDRMVVITFNTSMGVSVTKKVMAFTQQNHDNYFIYDYVFKNTGIYNQQGNTYTQTLNNFWVHFNYRYAFAGVSNSGWEATTTWGAFSSQWGATTVQHDFGLFGRTTIPTFSPAIPSFYTYCSSTVPDSIRGFYTYYGPHKDRYSGAGITYDEDWGCPKQNGGGPLLNGLLGSAKYAGVVTLFASQNPNNYSSDDPTQPRTTSYFGPDETICYASPNGQYDDVYMQGCWQRMTEGHLLQSHEESVRNQYVQDWNSSHADRLGGEQGQGFGPYTLAPGDSIHIVFAEGVSGMSWEKCREVGAVWYEYKNGTSTPPLIMPNGSLGTGYTNYARAWVQTGKDSIIRTFINAIANYRSGYNILRPPDPPSRFTVASGGDRIQLTWTPPSNAANLAGYVIYRSESNVKDYRTLYKKVFECDASVNSFNDTSAVRGFNYYYYIQSKDDGTRNDVKPGTPLYSSLFLTLTAQSANLLRPAGNLLGEVRVVPNPFDVRARKWQFSDVTGTSVPDRLMFYGIPPRCKLKIYTEDGTLIWEKNHTNGSGDETWDSKTSSGQIVASGIYILYIEVTEDTYATENKIAKYDIFDENLKLMYPTNALVYEAGDKIFSAGQSTFRKFVVIR
jgi:hypothetical protein